MRAANKKEGCPLCDPIKDPKGEVHGQLHRFVLISVAGTGGLTLPVDVEPYGPRDSEYAAAQRRLRRTVDHLGPRFDDSAEQIVRESPLLCCLRLYPRPQLNLGINSG